MSVPQASVVVGHGNEVVAARGLPAGRPLPQEEAGEVQVPAAAAAASLSAPERPLTPPPELCNSSPATAGLQLTLLFVTVWPECNLKDEITQISVVN